MGRPTVQQNVTGTHGAGTEMDIVCSETTGVAGSLPLFVDVCVTDPTTKSNIESGAARVPDCSAATRYNAKIRHYGLNPGGTPKIDTRAREFLPWVVESFGRVHPALDDWLRRAADAAAHAESTTSMRTPRPQHSWASADKKQNRPGSRLQQLSCKAPRSSSKEPPPHWPLASNRAIIDAKTAARGTRHHRREAGGRRTIAAPVRHSFRGTDCMD